VSSHAIETPFDSVGEQFEVNASSFVVFVMLDVSHPQLAPDLSRKSIVTDSPKVK